VKKRVWGGLGLEFWVQLLPILQLIKEVLEAMEEIMLA